MKITVIGGSGFIGTYLCKLFAENRIGFEIIDLKKSRMFPDQTKIADIRNLKELRESITGDRIVHLAAVHRDDVKDKSLYYETNVDGTENVSQIATEKNISTIVFTSSVAVYGFAPPNTGEAGSIRPFNDYGKSKRAAEEVLLKWQSASSSTRALSIIRPTVVFGLGNRGNVYNLFNQIYSGVFLMVGQGKNVKSLAYVENVSAFLDYSLRMKGGCHIFNYVDKPDLDMNQLVNHIRGTLKGKSGVGPRLPYWLALGLGSILDLAAKISGKTFPLSEIRVRKFCADTHFSSSIHALEDFEAPFQLVAALDQTLQREFINPDRSMGKFYTE
ncbi:NAD-dependent epimerase/dehydratase family protein [Yoonia algicola]|uniref:NAD-dependent epimerase/dehydratase family protein n=1 Tax=Yoonia algicola TaxID=3137368 RepID=A0AAN0MBT1_9RHOB